MPEAARAAVLTAPKRLELRGFPLPTIGSDNALVRIEACGICGTDYEQYDGEFSPHFPTIPGHEPLGIIAEIGEQACRRWDVDVGDRFDVAEAERAIQTLAGAFPAEQAVHIAIVPRQSA